MEKVSAILLIACNYLAAMSFTALMYGDVKTSMWLFAVAACFWIANALLDRNITVVTSEEPVKSVSQEERRLNAIRKIKTIARGMFEAQKGRWSTDNYHAYVRIRLNTELDDEIDDPDTTPFSHVMFSMLNGEWRIIFVETPEDMDLDYLESFDKIDNPFD